MFKIHLKLIYKSIFILILIFNALIPAAAALEHCSYEIKLIEKKLFHIITIDPLKYKIINISANQLHKNVTHVKQFAKSSKALMAINGGFFREIGNNSYVPAGALKINNVWQGIAYHPRGAIGWKSNSKTVLIDRLKTTTKVEFGTNNLPVSHFNPQYNLNTYKVIVYSSIYPNFSNPNIFNQPNFSIKEENDSYIFQIYPDLLSSHPSSDLTAAKLNVEVTPELDLTAKYLWEQVDFITSGGPILIKNNEIILDYITEKLSHNFLYTKRARTAICIDQNSYWKFIKTEELTIPKLAQIMKSLACQDAINLDGGSSSALYVSKQISKQQEVENLTTPVTDAIMVLEEIIQEAKQ